MILIWEYFLYNTTRDWEGTDNDVNGIFEDSEKYYYHADMLGSIVDISNNIGSIVKSYVYNSFGFIVQQIGTLDNFYTYTSREIDEESGLYYYRARYYDPVNGVFINEDPIGFNGGINFYTYVGGNPINNVDPYGLAFKTQKPGCDVILDIFETGCRRAACDSHDRCYSDFKCEASSWILGQGSSACNECNRKVWRDWTKCAEDDTGSCGMTIQIQGKF